MKIGQKNGRYTCVVALGLLAGSASAGTVFVENFETGPNASGGNYALPTQYYGHSSGAHFVSSATTIAVQSQYSGADGHFVSGRDTNYYASSFGIPILTTATFDISDMASLIVSMDLSRRSDGTFWDSTNHVDFEFAVDGGAWQTFASADTNGNDSAVPLFDGMAITGAFSTFSTTISGLSGDTMQLRIVWQSLSTGDSLAVDNLNVSTVPLPPAALGGLGLLAGVGAYRRLRR